MSNESKAFRSDESCSSEVRSALVFGASTEQGRAVIEGLVDAGFGTIYGVTRHLTYTSSLLSKYKHAHNVTERIFLLEADLSNSMKIKQVLEETKAANIFLVTSTDLPRHSHTSGCREAEEEEYETIKSFFDVLLEIYNKDGLERHVVFSSHDNVKFLVQNLRQENPGIEPLVDGSFVPQFSGKGRGADYGMNLIDGENGLTLTVLSLPFLYSNFAGISIPLPNSSRTEWSISSCLGNGAIDMFSADDLAVIVPEIFENSGIYRNYTIHLTAGKVPLIEIAECFSQYFGKDVIYNPLSYDELKQMDIPTAACLAQTYKYLSSELGTYSIDATKGVMFPRQPQTFEEWLLVHGKEKAFQEVGLTRKRDPIKTVCVFDADSIAGGSTVRALLENETIEGVLVVVSNIYSDFARKLLALDTNRVRLANVTETRDDKSLAILLSDIDGVFIMLDIDERTGILHHTEDEELHAIRVIDACEDSNVKHMVLCSTESIDDPFLHQTVEKKSDHDIEMKLCSVAQIQDYLHKQMEDHPKRVYFDAKARIAAYAKSEKISCTWVQLPLYPEKFLDLFKYRIIDEILTPEYYFVPEKDESFLACLSMKDLGNAVANIFMSYEEYSGHELGLATDFLTIKEIAQVIQETFADTISSLPESQRVTKIEEIKDKYRSIGTSVVDLGSMFAFFSQSEAVKKRHSIAKVLHLCPDPTPFKDWMIKNKYNPDIREKLGMR